jgi:hypothetical protein
MKKAVLVSAVLLVFAGLVAAPVAAQTKLNFGLKAGVSFSDNAWSDDDGSEKALIRPTFGAFAVINLSPYLAIQPEVNYLTTGEWWSDVIKVVETFNYIHIPVLVKARLMKEGTVVPFVVAGPAISFLLSAKEAGEDVKEFFKDTDFGADFGLGAEMAAGTMKVFLEARYFLGLTNAFSRPDMTVLSILPSDFTMKNRSLIISAGVIF